MTYPPKESLPLKRRQFLSGVGALSLTAPLAAVLADPRKAAAAAEQTEMVSLKTHNGQDVTAALAMPKQTPAAAVVLIHEWWGLNDHIKTMAAAMAEEGYIALAVDLYKGQVATDGNADMARSLMQAVDGDEATDTLTSWMEWLREKKEFSGKIGTMGWCFGGGWSLRASMASPADATVVYYGKVDFDANQLEWLKGPVMGHFATEDKWINQAMVDRYETAMKEVGKPFETYWYEAQHAFANPTSARYDQADAAEAWARTLTFLSTHLKG